MALAFHNDLGARRRPYLQGGHFLLGSLLGGVGSTIYEHRHGREGSILNKLVVKRDEIRTAMADRMGLGTLEALSSPQTAEVDRETEEAIAKCRADIKRENAYPNEAGLAPLLRLLVDYCRLEREENGSVDGDASGGFGARR